MKDLAQKIRQARRAANLSQKQLGGKLGISEMAISAYETGRATPPWPTLKKIADITGSSLDYFTEEKPMNNREIIFLAQQAMFLKKIKRQGWILKKVTDIESIADHVFMVAFLAMILSKGRQYNREKVIKMALVHDLGEALTGDIVYERGSKEMLPFRIKFEKGKKALQKILKKFDDKEEYFALWDEWAAQKTPEAKFVRHIEKLEMAIQAFEYEKRGYSLDEFYKSAQKYLKDSALEPIYKELLKQRQETIRVKRNKS